jgi:hypothetical protein
MPLNMKFFQMLTHLVTAVFELGLFCWFGSSLITEVRSFITDRAWLRKDLLQISIHIYISTICILIKYYSCDQIKKRWVEHVARMER